MGMSKDILLAEPTFSIPSFCIAVQPRGDPNACDFDPSAMGRRRCRSARGRMVRHRPHGSL